MDKSARIVGMIVFVFGIIVLLFVFATAYRMFTAPSSQFLSKEAVATGAGLGRELISVLIKIILLFIMTLAGSLVAARGIQLFLGRNKD